ncbi:kinase-like domain-containing protein [Fimicolochytrium jonesii]|uniref:kinase-like domain-containing protein n=1 Tax=Fimicolochytrium jonesii TaxID=1396493 RepID=UPI0022FE4AC8|nr:kinase-like domain-containing protein [Fimicolochytrium jonesii]KAI8824340.1 kinase-like domain-containing protein [Fimicolochytrium jonesii]
MRWHLPLAFLEQYGTVKDNLGSGGSGHIFSAIRRKDRKEVAVKILPRACVPPNAWVRDAQYGRIPREVAVLKNVKHPNAIDFFDLFEEDDFFLIVMEVFGGSWRASTVRSSDPNPLPLACRPARTRAMDLFELLEVRHLNEDEARIIFLQVVHCIDHMISTHHIVHGDIKDENILIDWTGDEPLAKLIDFGGTIDVAMRRMCGQADFHGTLEFAPPEVILGQAYDPEKAETWSLGVLLYGMINKGHGPFASPEATAFAGYRAIPCSASCSDLIASLLQKKQRYRATIKDILRHPWLSATKPRCPV